MVARGWRRRYCGRLQLSPRQMGGEKMRRVEVLDTGSNCGEEEEGLLGEGGQGEIPRSGTWFQTRQKGIRNTGGNRHS